MTEHKDGAQQSLSRREVLKTLAAVGGAVTVSSLVPARWAKPEVGAGVLPAHAQSTICEPPYTITDCAINTAQWVDYSGGFAIQVVSLVQVSPACDVELSALCELLNRAGAVIGHLTDEFSTIKGNLIVTFVLPDTMFDGTPVSARVTFNLNGSQCQKTLPISGQASDPR